MINFLVIIRKYFSIDIHTIESTIENVTASMEAVNARLASAMKDSSPKDHHVSTNTTK